MITQIGRLNPERLGVIARTSVLRYKRTNEGLGAIGRELGVQYVLEGSVRRDSERVRVAVQLIQVQDQTHLWTRQYDRQRENVLGSSRLATHTSKQQRVFGYAIDSLVEGLSELGTEPKPAVFVPIASSSASASASGRKLTRRFTPDPAAFGVPHAT
ncbi:MAG: hypothetical protein ACRD1S_10230 [Vicinamibacterales bacterium]